MHTGNTDGNRNIKMQNTDHLGVILKHLYAYYHKNVTVFNSK